MVSAVASAFSMVWSIIFAISIIFSPFFTAEPIFDNKSIAQTINIFK